MEKKNWEAMRLIVTATNLELQDSGTTDTSDFEIIAKLTSGANETIDLGIPNDEAIFQIKNDYDILRFTLIEKSTQRLFGTVSFSVDKFAEKFNVRYAHWVSLKTSPLSDDFKGELGVDQSNKPRIYLSYESHRLLDNSSTKPNIKKSLAPRSDYDKSRSSSIGALAPGNTYTKGNLKVSIEKKRQNPSRWGGRKAKDETIATIGEVKNDEFEKHMDKVTKDLIDEVNKQKKELNDEADEKYSKIKTLEKYQESINNDEADLKKISERAVQSLDDTKKYLNDVKKEQNDEQKQLLEQIKSLEKELDNVDNELALAEQENEEITLSIRKQKVIPEKKPGEDQRIASLRREADELITEIANAVRSGQVPPDFEIYRDENFLDNIDADTQKLLEKENERFNVELDVIDLETKCRNDTYTLDEKDHAAGIKDANIAYQNNHLDALKNELTRANKYYDQILNEVRDKIDEETKEIKDLELQLKAKKGERERLRKNTESLRAEISTSMNLEDQDEEDLDAQIKHKLQQVEDAENERKQAQAELDQIYQDWTGSFQSLVHKAYSSNINGRDPEQLEQIRKLIAENDEVARNVNELFEQKELIENKLYLQKTKSRLAETFDIDIKRMSENLERLREEDQLIIDELKRAEDNIQTKKHTIAYLDERIANLKAQLETLQGETAERRAHIQELKAQIESAQKEIDQIDNQADEEEVQALRDQIRAKEIEIEDLERKVKQKEAIYDEWRDRVSIKEKVVNQRSKSRKREYVPDPSDEADIIMAKYFNENQNAETVQRLGIRKYLVGTKTINVEEDSRLGPVVILDTGKVLKLYDYLMYYH